MARRRRSTIGKEFTPDIVRRAQAGDPEAFAWLWTESRAMVYAVVRDASMTHEQAEDLVSDTYLKAWRGIRDTRPGTNFAGWLWTIARRVKHDYLSSGHRRLSHAVDPHEFVWDIEAPDPADLVTARDEWDRLPFDDLTDLQKRILELRFVHDQDWAEIALIMDRKNQACRSLQDRALKQIRFRLEIERIRYSARS